MAYNTPESVADYLSRFQMQVTERTKGTLSPMHVKYSLTTSPPANGVCILSTPESVTVSMVA